MSPSRLILPLLLALLGACGQPPPLLDQIKATGVLRVASINGPTTIFEGPDGQTGFEHDMLSLLAKRLGVRLEYQMAEQSGQLLDLVQQGKVHLAAGGLLITPRRRQLVRFGPSYLSIDQHLVYRIGGERPAPKDFSGLTGASLEFAADSVLEQQLADIRKSHPGLEWTAQKDMDGEELINLVDQGMIDYCIAQSNLFALARRYHPQLRAGLSILKGREMAWALPHSADDSLYNAVRDFFAGINGNGQLHQLIERYYGHTEHLNFVDLIVFRRHYRQRLPEFQRLIKYAGFVTGLDWRLLAAIAYQESHWDPLAISPTGVRGLMMLTRATASDMGVDDRNNPQQSIIGGARYLKRLIEKLPESIGEPDRTWLALAGYNVGFGHLQDARVLALMENKDANKWSVVKEYLPRLTEAKWHRQTSHGYARGKEPVYYVDNIRSYYDLLLRFEEKPPIAIQPPQRGAGSSGRFMVTPRQ